VTSPVPWPYRNNAKLCVGRRGCMMHTADLAALTAAGINPAEKADR
jgi:hypothetical protein